MLGYVLGGVVISKFGFTWSFITSGLLCLTAVTMILLFVREDFVYRPKKYGKASRDRLKRLSPRKIPFPKFSYLVWSILMLFMLLGIVRIFDNPYVAMQVEVINGAADIAKWTAIISALAAIAGIGSGLLMGHLSDRFPANKIILPAFIGSAAMMALQGAAVNLPMLGGARFFKYFFASGMDPIFQSMLSRAVPKNKRGAAFGFSASCRTVGALLGSALSGVVVYQLGVRSVFYVGGILFLILLPLVLLVIKLSKKFKVS